MVELTEILRNKADLYERFLREGDPFTVFANGSATPAAGPINTGIVTTGGYAYIGKASWIESVTVSANQAGVYQLGIGSDAANRFASLTSQFILTPGQLATIPMKSLYRGYQVQNGVISLSCRRMLSASPGTDTVFAAIAANGWRITDDFHFNARKVALWLGDSILNGTGPTKTATMYPFIVRNYLRTLGYDIRNVLKSVSGSTASDWEIWGAGGHYDIEQVDVIFYALGANDAGNGATASAFRANLEAFWNRVRYRYPAAKVVILGSTPLENNTKEATSVTLRAEAEDFVNDTNHANLKFINLVSSFDRLTSSNYASSDTPGDRVHPSDAGHAAIASTIQSAWPGLGLTL